MAHPRGESGSDAVRLDFDRRLMLRFRGSLQEQPRSASKCQGKWPDQTLDQAFGLPEVLVAHSTSRLSCKRAGKTRTLMPVWDSSGESRLRASLLSRSPSHLAADCKARRSSSTERFCLLKIAAHALCSIRMLKARANLALNSPLCIGTKGFSIPAAFKVAIVLP
jgi:hypothetical protein